MIQARAQMIDGRVLIFLGLSEENIIQIKKDRPLLCDPQVFLKIQPGEVIGGIAIIYAETENALIKLLQDNDLMGPQTVTINVPKGSQQPQ